MAEGNETKHILSWVILAASVALILLIMLILFGNLSGNVGFASGTANYNNTQNVIGNYTQSAQNTAAQLPTVGTIIGVALLIFILVALLVFAIRKLMGMGSLTGGAGSFG